MTPELQNSDVSWRKILNCPEANVLSSMEERELLVELVACRQRILAGLANYKGNRLIHAGAFEDFQHVIRDLTEMARTGDAVALSLRATLDRYQVLRSKLAMANVRLVAHVAKKYNDRGVAASDLVQDGFCGLLLAIDRFDIANETRLATYAIWWIRQSIQRAVAATAYPVRLNPKQLHQLARGQSQDVTEEGGWGLPASRDNGGAPRAIDRVLAATRPTVSLDSPFGHDGNSAMIDYLVNPEPEEVRDDELNEDVAAMMKLLNAREQMVVKLRFGLDGERRCSLIEVGQIMGVSKERIRQIQQRALQKLRAGANCREVSRAG